MNPHILITEPEYFTEESIRRMRTVGKVEAKRMNRRELLSAIPHVNVLVVRIDTIVDRVLLTRAKKLRAVVSATTGLNHIDVDYLKSHHIPLFSLHGTHSVPTSEHAIALLFALARNIPVAHRHLTEGRWERWNYIGKEIAGSTLGIFGMGRIGNAVAKRARALDMHVIAYDPYVSKHEIKKNGAEAVSFKTLLRTSDFLTLHAPLTPGTSHQFGKKEFLAMKRSAFLINTARGDIVHEAALLQALRRGHIQGAAVDVYPQEPLPRTSALRAYARTHHNIILTPHIAASTKEAVVRASDFAARTVTRIARTIKPDTSRSKAQ